MMEKWIIWCLLFWAGFILGGLWGIRNARARVDHHIDDYWDWRESAYLEITTHIAGERIEPGDRLFIHSDGRAYKQPEVTE